MKKNILISVIVLVIIGIAGYFGYQHWQKGTPQYSLAQLQIILKNNDSTSAMNFIDENSIFNNFWPRVESAFVSANTSNAFGVSLFEGYKTTVQNVVNNNIYSSIKNAETGTGQSSMFYYVSDIFSQLENMKKPNFAVNGNVATLAIESRTDFDSVSQPAVNFTVVFTQQSDKTWKISDIQGLETIFNFNSATSTSSTN